MWSTSWPAIPKVCQYVRLVPSHTAQSEIGACLRRRLGGGAEHARVFAEAGWDRDRVLDELHARLQIPGTDLVRGANGIAEGIPTQPGRCDIAEVRPGGILLVHAGGGAGLFSAIIGGWANGDMGSTQSRGR